VQQVDSATTAPTPPFNSAKPNRSHATRPGDRLGPNEILAPIGAGGMGEVYKARDNTQTNITAANKSVVK
jgi:hypothetical protein